MGFRLCGWPTRPRTAAPPLTGDDETGEEEVVGEVGDRLEDGVGVTLGVAGSDLAVGETSSGEAGLKVGETAWQAVRMRTMKR